MIHVRVTWKLAVGVLDCVLSTCGVTCVCADPPSFAQISEDCGVLLSKTRDALQTDGVCLLQSQSEIVTGEKKP